METGQHLDIVILTGQSGSGKSTAVRALEDAGFFCVENLPTSLARPFVALIGRPAAAPSRRPTTPAPKRVAMVMDMRDQEFLQDGPDLVEALRADGHTVQVLFLRAEQNVVVRRFSQTRRLHPLDRGQGLQAAIEEEFALLAPLYEIASEVLDTSHYSPHQLRQEIQERLEVAGADTQMRVTVTSFGFKHGIPSEADMLFDVRFLPNPFFDPALAALSGEDEPVRDFVLQQPLAIEFIDQLRHFLAFLLPNFRREQKRYFTVAIGCTGGRHRSVAVAKKIKDELEQLGVSAVLRHRDMARFVAPGAQATKR